MSEADTAYYRINPKQPVARTLTLDDGVLIDLTEDGEVIGIELIDRSWLYAYGLIVRAARFPGGDRQGAA